MVRGAPQLLHMVTMTVMENKFLTMLDLVCVKMFYTFNFFQVTKKIEVSLLKK